MGGLSERKDLFLWMWKWRKVKAVWAQQKSQDPRERITENRCILQRSFRMSVNNEVQEIQGWKRRGRLQPRKKKDIKVKVQIAMESWYVQITGNTNVLTWQHPCQANWEHCFQVLVKAPEKDKIKDLKLVLLLPSLPNKVSKFEIQVDVIYQCLSLQKFLYPCSLSFSSCSLLQDPIFCFIILFCWWSENSNSSLRFEGKIFEKSQPTMK